MELQSIEGFYQKDKEELISEYPSLKQLYKNDIPTLLKCDYEDVVVLYVHSDFNEEDEEGWQQTSFFPQGSIIENEVIHENYQTVDFCIGLIERITFDGVTFISERNASPIYMYANKNLIK